MSGDTSGGNESGSELDFTIRAQESFYHAVDDPYFRDRDLQLIYDTLKKGMKVIYFGDFLKRYIYKKAEMQGNYAEIPLEQYQEIIMAEFQDRHTPASFTPSTARLKNLSKNWLTQQTVSRSVVLLLGFGLGMPTKDVNAFLTKALQEPKLNAKDPLEVICWYCYQYGYGYYKWQDLWEKYQQLPERFLLDDSMLENTISYDLEMHKIADEKDLMRFLSSLSIMKGSARQSIAARAQFDALYEKAREIVADLYTQAEMDTSGLMADRERSRLSRDTRLYDFEKNQRVESVEESYKVYDPSGITAHDLEQVIFAAVPRGLHGNMLPMRASALNEQFAGKRLNRQHISEILAGKAVISRYDLLTLNFFIYSQKLDQYPSARRRYSAFIDSTNQVLKKSGMGPMYVVNPYECFLLMCMLSDDPLGTYADVWEMSYENE